MPTYEYECAGCGHNFEAFQSMSEDPLKDCPSCGKPSLKRLVGGGIGVIFKGSGFYVTDSKNGKSSGKVSTETSGKESTSDAKTADSKASDSKTSESKSKPEPAGASQKSA